MPDRNARTDREPFQGLDDIEWELMCSAREATVGYIPDPEVWSIIAAADRGRPHPWEIRLDQKSGPIRLI